MSTVTNAQIKAVGSSMKSSDKIILADIARGIKTTGYSGAMAVARLSNRGLVTMGQSGTLQVTTAGRRLMES